MSLESLAATDIPELEYGEDGSNKTPPAVYAFDFETDPFKPWVVPDQQRIPKVFACGVLCLNTDVYRYCWGTEGECLNFLFDMMDAAPEGSYFYAHNGGKFDFHFFAEELHGKTKIIGARVAEAYCRKIKVRDSYALLPVPLSKFPTAKGHKLDIDIKKLEADVRDCHRTEIIAYMEQDCRVLGEALKAFFAEFGMALTMAGAAMKQLAKFHEYERIATKLTDDKLRAFYYGGRVECIESGTLTGDFKLYDVNSMYPAVMRNFLHPISAGYIEYTGKYAESIVSRLYDEGGGPDFIEMDAENDGCFPMVQDDKLSFRVKRGRFFVTGHELRAGLETKTIRMGKIHRAFRGEAHSNFATFIDHFFAQRLKAKEAGDPLLDLFYKLVMNSSYGKFAQNPDKYKDWLLSPEIMETKDGWVLEHTFPNGALFIWSKPSSTPAHLMRFNVGTAASVTGAARARLWRAICSSERPVYCDTDSLACEKLNPGPAVILDNKLLGAWKFEASGDRLAIGGKKMYALFNGGEAIKFASKGVRISARQIEEVAAGAEIEHRNEAPTFSMQRKPTFIKRYVNATATAEDRKRAKARAEARVAAKKLEKAKQRGA